MAKALRKVATVAAVVATVALVVANPLIGAPVAIAAAASTVASVATIVALAASVGAAALQKKPSAQGNSTQIQIGANMPMPYTMGRTYIGGNMIHDVGYGGTVDDVPNPYSSTVLVWSGGGPVSAIEAFQADFTTISFSGGEATGYYDNFMWLDTQLGATPESSALAGPHGAIPQWGSSHKLSGYCAGLVTMKFDKKGKRYASGVPQFGAILNGALSYDPRLDPARPGGSGSHAFDDETSFGYDDNPALNGVTYARGRYHNGKKVVGCGFGEDQFDWPAWIGFANVCDANGWTLGGTVYEGPGISRWDNLKRICAAGGAEPCFVGGLLSVRYPSPKTALDTITADDLADGDYDVPAMRSWRERKNGIVPRYRSENHRWEYVQSDLVTVEDYVTEDGEEKNEERQYDLVQDKDQAAQLAAYELTDGREFGLIVLPCKPRMIAYRPGEALEVDIPELGLNEQLCVIRARTVDPATGIVTLSLMSETTAKHAFALGLTGTAPPTPTLTTGEDMDEILATTSPPQVYEVASEAAQLALNAGLGDVAIRTDLSTTFIHNGGDTGTMADWTEALSPTAASAISFTPAGNIVATNVQAAIQELDTEKQPADATLTAWAAFNTNGILTQTAADTFTGRTITGTANEVSVANGNGGAGNPTISLPAAITLTGKTITGGAFQDLSSLEVEGIITTAGASAGFDFNARDSTDNFIAFAEADTWKLFADGGTRFSVSSAGNVDIAGALTLGTALAVAEGGTGGGSASGTLLDNITGFSSTGVLVRTGAGTYAFRTITAGFGVSLADGNGVSANPTISRSFSGCLLKKAANQTGANYSSGAVVAWDTETYDTDGYHESVTNPSRITIPTDGRYVFRFGIQITNGTSNDYLRAAVILGGSVAAVHGLPWVVTDVSTTVGYLNGVSAPIDCTASQYFEVWFDTESDASVDLLATGCWFSVERVL